MTDVTPTRCGMISIVGRPNVGKSTLMNHLIGQKVSITSRKPQTTRHRIHGIHTRDNYQIIFADTPGIHTGQERALNRAMNEAAVSTLSGVDVVCMMVDGLKWTPADEYVLSLLPEHPEMPVLLIINKVDSLDDKAQLLPHIEALTERYPFDAVVPVSALKEQNLMELEKALVERLPEGEFWYDEDQLTDRSLRFMAAEIIREKVVRQLGRSCPIRSAWKWKCGKRAPASLKFLPLSWWNVVARKRFSLVMVVTVSSRSAPRPGKTLSA